jgi:ketose-bisphosphate aldolase
MKANMQQIFSNLDTGSVGSFNVLDLNIALAVVESAEALQLPAIIGVASRHFDAINTPVLAASLVKAAEAARVPIALHLDHAGPDQINMIERALDLGFSSIMIDGSTLPFAENVSITHQVVQAAQAYAASVEGELGGIAGEEGVADSGTDTPDAMPYTDASEAKRFVDETGVDALAIAVGTAHGIYAAQPQISFDTIEACAAATSAPLVMHGATGVGDADMQRAVRGGIRKINFFSGLLKGGMDEVRSRAHMEGNDFLAFNQALRDRWGAIISDQMKLYALMDGAAKTAVA